MTVTKASLSEKLFGDIGLNKREAGEFAELFFEQISLSLEQGAAIKLSGFGVFALRDKAARPGRNPRTGESVEISARRVVTFRPSRRLRTDISANAPALVARLGRRR